MSNKYALIVDSNPERATRARHLLQTAGFQAEVVGDGWSALVCLQRSTPDLILVQPRLSIVSGYEVTRYARTDQRLAGARILMLGDSSLTGPAVELADEVLELPLQGAALLQAASTASAPRTMTRAREQLPSISPTALN